MRKKLWFAVVAVAVLGVAAGAHLVSGLNAQDPPKKEDAKKDDWFENLKKALEAKKDVVPPPASIDVGGPKAPVVPPPLPAVKDDKQVIPPPMSLEPLAPLSQPDAKKPSGLEVPPPTVPMAPKNNDQIKPLEKKDFPSAEKFLDFTDPPKPAEKTQTPPMNPAVPTDFGAIPPPAVKPEPIPPMQPPVEKDLPKQNVQEPVKPAQPLSVKPSGPTDVPQLTKPAAPPTVQISPNQQIGEQVAKLKDCAWSLHVDIVDGKTIMTATVNKKHEFRIVCQSIDLQTSKHMLKATGKVQIIGDMMSGNCDHLSIPLMEDRLVMEGGASVSIQKMPANVSTDKPASFELKGSTLDVRVSDLPAGKLIQASWQPTRENIEAIPMSGSTPVTTEGKKWTTYGRLTPAKIQLANEMAWGLVGSDGKVIAYVVARDGGTLDQYEGRTISVLGTNEQISGRSYLRVTHIALP
jgi:hypothetical protein